MMSRLNQLNDTRLTLPLLYRAEPVLGYVTSALRRCVTVTFAVGYRIPPSVMPWTAFEQTDQGKPTTPDESELAQSIDGVLATRRSEPTCGQSQRRDRVAIELNGRHHGADRP